MPGHAIVIVDHRAPDLGSRCLAAAGAADEVVVVDTASGDGSVERLRERHPGVTVPARARDDGFAAGVVAPRLVRADGSPQPSAHRRFGRPWQLAADRCLPVGAALVRVPRLDRHRLRPEELADGRRVADATGAALTIRRAACEDAGPFDEGCFLHLEETD